jgi:phosphatidylserine decarboxylase
MMGVGFEQFRQSLRIHGGLAGLLTAVAGVHLSRMPIPGPHLRKKVYSIVYGKKYGALRDEELEKPLTSFRSLNELFARGVRDELRPVSQESGVLLSPVDGMVQDTGLITDSTVLTVKQIPYKIQSICPETDTQSFNQGQFAILFLSPRDCHRVYAPADCRLLRAVHVPGYRLPVHPPFQRAEYPVFTLNERLILELQTEWGRVLLIMVAGWGVGCMTHPFPLPLKHSRRSVTGCELSPPKAFVRGEWLATFELGSTVILMTENGRALRCLLPLNGTTRLRQPLFQMADPDKRIAGGVAE